MKKIDNILIDQTLSDFRIQKVMTIDSLGELLKCSQVTIRRYLQAWKAITSYNKNGRYYSLPNIVRFNKYGLWEHNGIRFSKHGNLMETILWLAENSDEGITAKEIAELLGIAPHSLLARLNSSSMIPREKLDGKYVYFSTKETTYREQLSRNKTKRTYQTQGELSCHQAIELLVEKIRHPNVVVEELSKSLVKRGVKIGVEQIIDFFTQHGIEKKTLVL